MKIYLFCFCLILGYSQKLSNNSSNSETLTTCKKFFSGVSLAIWDHVNLVFYNLIPFLIMITFNTLLIFNIKKKLLTNSSSSSSSSKRRPGLTISLITVSFLFLIMTTPGTIVFAYFYNVISGLDVSIIYLIDDISFLNHALIFFISFVSIKKFRTTITQVLIMSVKKSKRRSNDQRADFSGFTNGDS